MRFARTSSFSGLVTHKDHFLVNLLARKYAGMCVSEAVSGPDTVFPKSTQFFLVKDDKGVRSIECPFRVSQTGGF